MDYITIEKFAKIGIKIGNGSHDIAVKNCTVQNATDLGGGGAGYAFTIQGGGHSDPASGSAPFNNNFTNPYLGTYKDTYYVSVEGCNIKGSYMRHGILLQYWTHNNLVKNNTINKTQIDAIDLHGEDEYNNEICYNTITNIDGGGGCGLGNTSSGHDKSGPNNWIHHNTISGSKNGITVEFGTGYTVVENNTIQNDTAYTWGVGIALGLSYKTVVRNNIITGNSAGNYRGINLRENTQTAVTVEYRGSPYSNIITNNTITNNNYGITVDADGGGNNISGNTYGGNTYNNSYPY